MKHSSRFSGAKLLAYLSLPLLVLLPIITQFIFPPGSHYSDIAISHFPNAVFLRDSILSGRGIPLWSDSILSGYPFAANPLSGLWYPPGWLALLFPLPFGLNLAAAVHLIFAGFGMYFWLRSEGLQTAASLLGGLLFQMMPKLWGHYAAGHLTLIYAVSWTPWLLWADRSWSANRLRQKYWLAPGVFFALLILADIRWSIFAGLIWAAYHVFRKNDNPVDGSFKSDTGRNYRWLDKLRHLVFQAALGLMLAAPLLLPLGEYSRAATRSQLTPNEAFIFSMPPSNLLGLLFPTSNLRAEWAIYPSGIALALITAVVFRSRLNPKILFWLAAAGISLIYAMGDYIPGLKYLALLPGFSLLRVPARALFLTGMAFASLAAFAANDVLNTGPLPNSPQRVRVNLSLAFLAFLPALMAIGIVLLTGELPPAFAWGATALLAAALWVGLWINGKLPKPVWILLILVLAAVDLGGIARLSMEARSIEQVLAEGLEATALISNGSHDFRTYSPSYSIPQQTAAVHQLQLADGIDPMQLSAYVDFMKSATGVPMSGYSVTLPAFDTANPATDNARYKPDARLLGLLNVKYVVSAFEITADDLVLDAEEGGVRVYENKLVMPRAWVQPDSQPLGDGIVPAEIVDYSPNRILVSVNNQLGKPATLVLSEVNYPGWIAYVDGRRVTIDTAGGLFRSLPIDSGKHEVLFVFRPMTVYIGLAISLLSMMLSAASLRAKGKHNADLRS